MLARPRLVTPSASGPASSSRSPTGSGPPAGTSSTNPPRRCVPAALLASLPLRSSSCEAADSGTSCVSVCFIGILRSVCGAARRHHRSPHRLESRRGRSRESLLVLHKVQTVTLCLEGKSSPFWAVIAGSSVPKKYLPARDLFGKIENQGPFAPLMCLLAAAGSHLTGSDAYT